jgi:hypothetical protein
MTKKQRNKYLLISQLEGYISWEEAYHNRCMNCKFMWVPDYVETADFIRINHIDPDGKRNLTMLFCLKFANGKRKTTPKPK